MAPYCVYTAPDSDLMLQEASEGQKRRDRLGTEYTQAMIDTSGTKEGERVETWGMVEAAPKPVNRGRNSPLQFFLSKIGKKGGDKTKQRGREYYSQLGKKGMAKRWRQKKRRGATEEDIPQSLLSKH